MRDRPAQPLVQSVEDLTARGYVVFTAEQFEEICVLLGILAFGSETEDVERRAVDLLATFPARREARDG